MNSEIRIINNTVRNFLKTAHASELLSRSALPCQLCQRQEHPLAMPITVACAQCNVPQDFSCSNKIGELQVSFNSAALKKANIKDGFPITKR